MPAALEHQKYPEKPTGNDSLPCHHNLEKADDRGKMRTWLQTKHRNAVVRQATQLSLGSSPLPVPSGVSNITWIQLLFQAHKSQWYLLPQGPSSILSHHNSKLCSCAVPFFLFSLVHTENVNKQDSSSSSPDFLKALTAPMEAGRVQVRITVKVRQEICSQTMRK